MRVVELAGEQASTVVEDWGYPRPITVEENVESKWFSYGGHAVWWLNRNALHEGGELSLHICIDPAYRERIYGRKLLYAIEIVAELMHAERLVTWLEPGSPVASYLARMAWKVLLHRGANGLVAWSRELGGEGRG